MLLLPKKHLKLSKTAEKFNTHNSFVLNKHFPYQIMFSYFLCLFLETILLEISRNFLFVPTLLLGSSGGGLQFLLADTVLLECTHEGGLVGRCLESSVTHLRAGIDELKVDVLECCALGVHQQ